MNYRNSPARSERIKEKDEAGSVSSHFPEIKDIVITMSYKQKGLAHPIQRTVNLYPGSCAIFRIECLMRDCAEGGFDLSQVISRMVRGRKGAVKGELACEGTSERKDHASISYEVAIRYN